MGKRKPGRPKKNRASRVVWRGSDGRYHDEPGEGRRAYGDFRGYSDVGGGREALSPGDGTGWATTDPDVAEALFSARLAELQEKRKGHVTGQQRERNTTLGELAAEHLRKKKRAGKVSRSHLENLEYELRAALDYFGRGIDPRSIEPDDVRKWAEKLATTGRRGSRSPSTVRHYLMALSDLYGRAIEGLYVPPNYNPVQMLKELPSAQPTREADFLEVPDAALVLEAARVVDARERGSTAAPGLFPMVATMLLTGGRRSEVLGLDVEDVSFDQGKVRFRPNEWRTLKTKTSHRVVPLWPQLRGILQEWTYASDPPRTEGLLFRSRSGGRVGDLRKSLDAVGELAGFEEGVIRTKMFRHTYCSARLECVQRILKPGANPATDPDPYEWTEVSQFQVGKEMGHGGQQMVQRVYGHATENPYRSETVEYRAGKILNQWRGFADAAEEGASRARVQGQAEEAERLAEEAARWREKADAYRRRLRAIVGKERLAELEVAG